jgi:predicted N-acetyltransferase YhbS
LIKFSIEKAKELGYKAIIIQGYVNYYKRFGFIGAKKYGITD